MGNGGGVPRLQGPQCVSPDPGDISDRSGDKREMSSMMRELFRALFLTLAAFIGMFGPAAAAAAELRYLPVGDSYTIGEGVPAQDRFPNQLVSLLRSRGIKVTLVGNPARSGYTSDLVIREELPVLRAERPSMTTVLVGANDWVRGYSEKTFRTYLRRLLEETQAALTPPAIFVVVTIPDFSKTRIGSVFARGRNISAGIAEFNAIIREEGDRVGATVVDVSDDERDVAVDPALTGPDGLHPTGRLYRRWAERIADAILPLQGPLPE